MDRKTSMNKKKSGHNLPLAIWNEYDKKGCAQNSRKAQWYLEPHTGWKMVSLSICLHLCFFFFFIYTIFMTASIN
jgi:hypothetical protein